MTSQYLTQAPRPLIAVLREKIDRFGPVYTAERQLDYIDLVLQWAKEVEKEAASICFHLTLELGARAQIAKDIDGNFEFLLSEALYTVRTQAEEEIQRQDDILESQHIASEKAYLGFKGWGQ